MGSGFIYQDKGCRKYICPKYGVIDLDRLAEDEEYRERLKEMITPWYKKVWRKFVKA